MRKTVLLLFAMILAMSSFAQPRTITPADGEMWWGYFVENDANADNFSAMGVDVQANYEAAIFIPKNSPTMGAATIKAVRMWFNETTIPKITKLTFWINTSLKTNMQGALYTQEIDPSTLTAGLVPTILSLILLSVSTTSLKPILWSSQPMSDTTINRNVEESSALPKIFNKIVLQQIIH